MPAPRGPAPQTKGETDLTEPADPSDRSSTLGTPRATSRVLNGKTSGCPGFPRSLNKNMRDRQPPTEASLPAERIRDIVVIVVDPRQVLPFRRCSAPTARVATRSRPVDARCVQRQRALTNAATLIRLRDRPREVLPGTTARRAGRARVAGAPPGGTRAPRRPARETPRPAAEDAPRSSARA
jgi:hypothetical protein